MRERERQTERQTEKLSDILYMSHSVKSSSLQCPFLVHKALIVQSSADHCDLSSPAVNQNTFRLLLSHFLAQCTHTHSLSLCSDKEGGKNVCLSVKRVTMWLFHVPKSFKGLSLCTAVSIWHSGILFVSDHSLVPGKCKHKMFDFNSKPDKIVFAFDSNFVTLGACSISRSVSHCEATQLEMHQETQADTHTYKHTKHTKQTKHTENTTTQPQKTKHFPSPAKPARIGKLQFSWHPS